MKKKDIYALVNKLSDVDPDKQVDLRIYDYGEDMSFSIAVKSSDHVLFELDAWSIYVRLHSISKDREIYAQAIDQTFTDYEIILKDFFAPYKSVNLNGVDVPPNDIVLTGYCNHSYLPEIVGAAEAADLLNITKKSLYGRMARGTFPTPITQLSASLIWLKSDILAFRNSD